MRARITKPKKTILIYGLQVEQQDALKKLCEKAQVECRIVTDGMLSCKVAQLFDAPESIQEKEPISVDGKFAMLGGFGSDTDEGVALINQVDSSVIKAVRTQHNGEWKFKDLCTAILEEHQVMSGQKENPYKETEKK